MAVWPGSKTSYPNSTAVRSRKGGRSKSTRFDTLYPGPYELRDDHLPGSPAERLENEYKKTGPARDTSPWPALRGRGYANTFTR